MSAGQIELAEIFKRVHAAKCVTVEDVGKVVDAYFQWVVWSLLKEEWDQMNDVQKGVFVARVFFDTRRQRRDGHN